MNQQNINLNKAHKLNKMPRLFIFEVKTATILQQPSAVPCCLLVTGHKIYRTSFSKYLTYSCNFSLSNVASYHLQGPIFCNCPTASNISGTLKNVTLLWKPYLMEKSEAGRQEVDSGINVKTTLGDDERTTVLHIVQKQQERDSVGDPLESMFMVEITTRLMKRFKPMMFYYSSFNNYLLLLIHSQPVHFNLRVLSFDHD